MTEPYTISMDTGIPVYQKKSPDQSVITKEDLLEYYRKILGDVQVVIEEDKDNPGGWLVCMNYPITQISFDVLDDEED